MIIRPISATPNFKRDTVKLFFPKGYNIQGPTSVEMYVRGAVAWPEGSVPGMALVAGQDMRTKEIWIFDDYLFLTFKPLFTDHLQREIGLQLFLNEIWIRYGCRALFYAADNEIHQLYSRQVYRDDILKPIGVGFIKTPYTDEKTADDLLKTMVALKTIHWSAQSDVEIQRANAESRGRHALRTLVAGFEYLPWRDWS